MSVIAKALVLVEANKLDAATRQAKIEAIDTERRKCLACIRDCWLELNDRDRQFKYDNGRLMYGDTLVAVIFVRVLRDKPVIILDDEELKREEFEDKLAQKVWTYLR